MRQRRNEEDTRAQRAARSLGGVFNALAEGIGRKPKYVGKELSVVSSAVASLAAFDAALENPSKLIDTHGMSKIDDMLTDDTIHGIFKGMTKTRLSTNWRILPPEEDPKDSRHMAAFIEWNFRNMEGSLKKALEEIYTAWAYGFSVSERVLAQREVPDLGTRIVLDALKCREPHGFTFHVDEHGNLKPDGIHQMVKGEERKYAKDIGDGGGFVIYSYDKRFGNLNGLTALGPAFRSWFSKGWIIKFDNMGLERYAMGIPEIDIDLDSLPGGVTAEQAIDRAEAILNGLQSDSKLVLPSGYTFNVNEMAGGGMAAFKDAILLHNGMIATALLAPEQAGFTQTDGGAYGKAKAQMPLWYAVIDDLGEDTATEIVGEQIIRPLTDLNFSNVEHYPTFEFDPLTEDDKFALASAVLEAVKAGAIKHWTVERQEWLAEKLGVPLLPDDVLRLLKDTTISPGGGGDGAAGGGGEPSSDEDEAEDAGTPDADGGRVEMAEPFPARVFQLAGGRGKAAVRDNIEQSAIEALAAVAKDIRNDQMAWVEKLLAMPKGKAARALKKRKLKNVGELRRIVHAMMLMAALSGKKDVRAEIERSPKTDIKLAERHELADVTSIALIPQAVRAYFKNIPLRGDEAAVLATRAFDVSGGLSSQMLKEVKQVLYDALKHNDARKARMELKRIFQGYLDTGELKDGAVTHPWRIETIVRNNTRDAYAQGRLSQLEDPDVAEVVVAYTNTVIFDDNTTDICEDGMEGPFDKDDYVPPPYHHACRTIGPSPIFEDEKYELTKFRHDKVAEGFDA